MKMKKIVAGIIIMLLLIINTSLAFAKQEPHELSAIQHEIDLLNESGKYSNAYLNHTIINVQNITSGTVTAYAYTGEEERLTVNSFDVLPQKKSSATDKITRFVFALTNDYRPETEMSLNVSQDRETVRTYTYGDYKDEAMLAIVIGLPECLDKKPVKQYEVIRTEDGIEITPVDDPEYEWIEKYKLEEILKTFDKGFQPFFAAYSLEPPPEFSLFFFRLINYPNIFSNFFSLLFNEPL